MGKRVLTPEQKRVALVRSQEYRARLKARPMTAEERDRRNTAMRAWNKKNRHKIRAMVTVRKKRNRAMLDELKNRPCEDCGGMFPPCCMDYDHVRGAKLFVVGQGINRSVAQIMREIEKCDLVCANCHRVRSMNRGWHRSVGVAPTLAVGE